MFSKLFYATAVFALILMPQLASALYIPSNNAMNSEGTGSISPGTTTSLSDFLSDPDKYVTISSCPKSATTGNNYGFYSDDGTQFRVTVGQKFYVTSQSWTCSAATATILISTSTTAPTWDTAGTGVTSSQGVLWDDTNISGPFYCPAGGTVYRSNFPLTISSGRYPYLHAANASDLCITLNGIMQ